MNLEINVENRYFVWAKKPKDEEYRLAIHRRNGLLSRRGDINRYTVSRKELDGDLERLRKRGYETKVLEVPEIFMGKAIDLTLILFEDVMPRLQERVEELKAKGEI